MGLVYRARDTHLDRFVAVKVLPPGRVADPERKRRFIQEAKAASALNHPNIITIYDIDRADGSLSLQPPRAVLGFTSLRFALKGELLSTSGLRRPTA